VASSCWPPSSTWAILFAIAYYGDKRAEPAARHRQPGHLFAVVAVYATSWTFYGSIGRAAVNGVGFLPIYLGPTLMCCALVGGAAQDDPHQQGAAASPRSRISSRRATARAHCWAVW